MAANIESMMWVGNVDSDRPWHMSPERLYGYGGQDPMTAADTITLAKLDWNVNLLPAAVEVGGRVYTSEDIMCITRDRDNKILGTCTERYQPIQNSEAFSFLDAVAGDLGSLRYVTAGAIDGGRRVWVLAQLKGDQFTLEPILGDKVHSYILATSGHDGKNSLKVKFTSIRVVCQNTLTMALRTGEDGITIKHIGDPMKKVQQAREILGLATQEIEAFRKVTSWLSSMRVTRDYTKDFLEAMAPTEEKGTKAVTRAENIQKELHELSVFGKGTHLEGVTGTRWALLNAVTEYGTHQRNFRTTRESGRDTNKFDALFNGGVVEKMNRRALDFLLQDAPADVLPELVDA
jgi:phage/plasmid-like protein (TIGR03299 family)